MSPAERPPCSSLSRAFAEEQVGTASRYRFWLMLEQPGPWGHDALVESRFPAEVGAELRLLAHRRDVRVLLIKHRQRTSDGARRCYAAFTGRRERHMVTFELDDPRRLLEMDLPDLIRRRFHGLGEPVPGPLYLVCTHGKHDACCARHGAPLYRALADFREGAVWEATHVGGDRFAGNLVCFPHGLYFGRVGPGDARAVARAYAGGTIDLAFYRGRSAYSPEVQAAEYFLRRAERLLGVDDLDLVDHGSEGNVHAIGFRAGGTRFAVEVEVRQAHERPLTCKAIHPHRPRAFALRTIRRE
jgi:hypothetical protein